MNTNETHKRLQNYIINKERILFFNKINTHYEKLKENLKITNNHIAELEQIYNNFGNQKLNIAAEKRKKHTPFAKYDDYNIERKTIKDNMVEILFSTNPDPRVNEHTYINSSYHYSVPHSYSLYKSNLIELKEQLLSHMKIYMNNLKFMKSYYENIINKYENNQLNESEKAHMYYNNCAELELFFLEKTEYFNNKYLGNKSKGYDVVYIINQYPHWCFIDTNKGTKIANCFAIAYGNNKWNIFFDYFDKIEGFNSLCGRRHMHDMIIDFNKNNCVTMQNYEQILKNLSMFWLNKELIQYDKEFGYKLYIDKLDDKPKEQIINLKNEDPALYEYFRSQSLEN